MVMHSQQRGSGYRRDPGGAERAGHSTGSRARSPNGFEPRGKPTVVRVCRPWLERSLDLGRPRGDRPGLKPDSGNPTVRDFRGPGGIGASGSCVYPGA